MSLSAADYLEGALLRREEAWALYERNQWVGAIYIAGRAVECLLRCMITMRNVELEVGHDLRKQFAHVRHVFQVAESESLALEKSVNELSIVWRNDLRYSGSTRMMRLLRDARRTRRIGTMRVVGDPLKANAKNVLESCEGIISRGEPICRPYWKS